MNKPDFSFSLVQTIKKGAQYCKEQGLPFPKIDEKELQDEDNPSDCYIFKGKGVPTVMHFPLFNKVNCPGKLGMELIGEHV